MRVPTIKFSGDVNNVYLTAGIQPPSDEGSVTQQTKCHSEFQSYASGGSIYHIFLNEEMSPVKKSNFIKRMFTNFPIRYISLTPFLSICNECGKKYVGKRTSCECDSKDISIWQRPVGYFRPAMRNNISENIDSSEYTFWSSARLSEMVHRRDVMKSDVEEFINEMEAGI